jgi:DNA-binding NarL/FixJ family response regulator
VKADRFSHTFIVQTNGAGRPVVVRAPASLERVNLPSLAEIPAHLQGLLDSKDRPRRRPGRAARHRLAGLTRSQSRVAELAIAGLTNRQIATTLDVKLRTVESHLTAAYAKLGISARVQLADALQPPDTTARGKVRGSDHDAPNPPAL